jgi:hypothetical protein
VKTEFARFEDLVDRNKQLLIVVASASPNHFPQNEMRSIGQSHCPKSATHVKKKKKEKNLVFVFHFE